MKNIPTLKVSYYRKKKYYIRHVHGETFEILVPAFGNLHSHMHRFTKEKRKKRSYTQEELASISHAMNEMAQILIDDIIFQHSNERWQILINRLKGRFRFIAYKLSTLYDGIEEKYLRTRRRHRRTAKRKDESIRLEQGNVDEKGTGAVS